MWPNFIFYFLTEIFKKELLTGFHKPLKNYSRQYTFWDTRDRVSQLSSGPQRRALGHVPRLHYPNGQQAESVIILPEKSNFTGKKVPKEVTHLLSDQKQTVNETRISHSSICLCLPWPCPWPWQGELTPTSQTRAPLGEEPCSDHGSQSGSGLAYGLSLSLGNQRSVCFRFTPCPIKHTHFQTFFLTSVRLGQTGWHSYSHVSAPAPRHLPALRCKVRRGRDTNSRALPPSLRVLWQKAHTLYPKKIKIQFPSRIMLK